MQLNVAAVQFDITWNNPEDNIRKLTPLVAEAAKVAKLIVLPEMFPCGFSLCTGAAAQLAFEHGVKFLRESAKVHGCWMAGSLPTPGEASFTRPLNSLVIVSPDGAELSYSKIHLFGFGGEAKAYQSGSKVITVEIEGVRVTPFVCYDIRFPKFFSLAAPETDLFLVVANWPITRRLHWEILAQARAIENQAALLAVNRIGQGGGLEYHGGTRGYSATGEVIFDLGSKAGYGVMQVDGEIIAKYRQSFPVLKDTRSDLGELS